MMLGLTNPFAFAIPEYNKYNITKLTKFVRFLEVVLNREGESNDVLALYFDGAVNYFAPLPPYDNLLQLEKVYKLIHKNMEVS